MNPHNSVKAILDANRNSLMLLDLKFSVWTVGLAAGTFVAALYGMNLKNFIEESDLGFWGVSAWCAIATLLTSTLGLGRLRRVQRVSMWGEHGARRSSWRDLGPQALLSSPAAPHHPPSGSSSSPMPPNPAARVPPVGAAAAEAALAVGERRAEKLRKLKDLHAQQAQGVNAEVAARRHMLGGHSAASSTTSSGSGGQQSGPAPSA